ncbi:MAG: hypothetical protein ACOY7P_19130 [Pseudomonadota bacterium]
MQFTTRLIVVGLKRSKGQLDNGQAYDSTKAYVLTNMDTRKGDARGQAVAEYSIGESTEFEKFAHVPLPFEADADVELVSNGKTQKTVVHALRPVSAAPKQPPAKQAS